MANYIFIAIVVLYAGRLILSQDCSTEDDQLLFLEENLKSRSECYDALKVVLSGELDLDVFNEDDVKAVSEAIFFWRVLHIDECIIPALLTSLGDINRRNKKKTQIK